MPVSLPPHSLFLTIAHWSRAYFEGLTAATLATFFQSVYSNRISYHAPVSVESYHHTHLSLHNLQRRVEQRNLAVGEIDRVAICGGDQFVFMMAN
jgi:hypothetical protein